MGRGLDLILSKIREQPSSILANRYLSLVAELEDEVEKLTRTLDLAEVLVSIRPKEALRLAFLAHRAHRSHVRPLDVMIRVMEAMGKRDRAQVLKDEKQRLEALQAQAHRVKGATPGRIVPDIPSRPFEEKPAPSRRPPQTVQGVFAQQGAESRILEAYLGDMFQKGPAPEPGKGRENRTQKPSPAPPVRPQAQPQPQSPTPQFTKATAVPYVKPTPTAKEPVVAPQVQQELHRRTQLSPRIIRGLEGKSPSDTILGIRAHSEPPVAPKMDAGAAYKPSGDSGFVLNLNTNSDREVDGIQAPMDLREGASQTNISKPLVEQRDQPKIPTPSTRPNQTRISHADQGRPDRSPGMGSWSPKGPTMGEERKSLSSGDPVSSQEDVPGILDLNFRSKAQDTPDQAVKDVFIPSTELGPGDPWSPLPPSDPREAGKVVTIYARDPRATLFKPDLLMELGRIASRTVIEPECAKKPKRSDSQSAPQLLKDGPSWQELLGRLGPGKAWDGVAWELFQALWGTHPDENGLDLLELTQKSHESPGFWGFYLDGFVLTSDYRRALWDIRTTLKLNPTLPWVEVAAKRLPKIWTGLGVQGFEWKPEDGVDSLLKKLSRTPIPLMPALVGSLVEQVDHNQQRDDG